MSINGINLRPRQQFGFYEWLWLLIGGISSLSILMLVLERFNPVLVVLGATAVVLLAGIALGLRFTFDRDHCFTLGLFVILVVALFFRWGPYPHHVVGQDQGLYVNMAKVFGRTGSLDFKDPLRADLSEQQQKLYDANGGALFLSAYPVDDSKTKIRMCFYPLHPAWMAIFARGLGEARAGYSVVFFALLAIVGLYLLTLEISNNRMAAYLTALFTAFNPGLVFFAKFPVSEMVALAFTSNGLYFLCRGYRRLKQDSACWPDLVLAAGCFNAFFYTRMSAVYYLPFMALLLLCGLIDLPTQKQRVKIMGFFLCLALLFGLSWLFYCRFLTPLFSDVVNQFSRRLMGPLNPHRIPVLAGIGFMFCALVLFVLWWVNPSPRRMKLQSLLSKLGVLAPVLIIISLAMHPVWKIIGDEQANFTNFWKFSTDVPGWRMFFYSSIYRYILYLSPFGFVLLIVGVFLRKIRKNGLTALAMVFLAFMMAACLFQPYSAYAFYFDRYYLSEVIPCGLMLMAIIIAPAAPITTIPDHWLRGGIVVLIAAYFAFFSLCQLNKTEGSYPDFFSEVNETLGSNDLLFYEEGEWHQVIKGCLVAYFNIKVFPVKAELELRNPEITELGRKFDHVYFLSPKEYDDPEFSCVRRLRYTEGFFIAGSHAWTDSSVKIMKNPYDYLLPFKHYERSKRFYLYRLDQASKTNGQRKILNEGQKLII